MYGSRTEDGSTASTEWAIRAAEAADVAPICELGEAHIRPHYTPLIGGQAAELQVSNWWNESHIQSAVFSGLIVIAVAESRIIGVAQRGRNGSDHVLYKLYLDPDYRGRGLGPALIESIIQNLPSNAPRLCVEHFAGNERAAAFYEREGFIVERIERSDANSALDVVWRARDL